MERKKCYCCNQPITDTKQETYFKMVGKKVFRVFDEFCKCGTILFSNTKRIE